MAMAMSRAITLNMAMMMSNGNSNLNMSMTTSSGNLGTTIGQKRQDTDLLNGTENENGGDNQNA